MCAAQSMVSALAEAAVGGGAGGGARSGASHDARQRPEVCPTVLTKVLANRSFKHSVSPKRTWSNGRSPVALYMRLVIQLYLGN